MMHLPTLEAYCKHIRIPTPRHSFYDIRSFEDNMKTVKPRVEPFRHEFYAVALRIEGDGMTKTGPFRAEHDRKFTLFFNSPYQEVFWDIAPNWKGYYIIFGNDFMERFLPDVPLLQEFTFFRIDNTVPMFLTEQEAGPILNSFEVIFHEYYGNDTDAFRVIAPHTRLLMEYTRRYFQRVEQGKFTETNRNADVLLVSRLKVLIEIGFSSEEPSPDPHLAASYAAQLRVHPNYLNAVVKRTTGKSLKQLIQEYIVSQARTLLATTELSIKEIAYRLHFEEPTHFVAVFKKLTSLTPGQFRQTLHEG